MDAATEVFTCVVHGPLPLKEFHPSSLRHKVHRCRACVSSINSAYYRAIKRRGGCRSVTEDILKATAALVEERKKEQIGAVDPLVRGPRTD